MHALDHVVFNARDRMDDVVSLFERLGFTIAPRGHHTLGSINHVIVFERDYLELLGYPPGRPPERRPELVAQPIGLMATVLATGDADATHADLIRRGLRPRPVQTFSRPVDLGEAGVHDASFRVTRLEPDAVPGTWFYYCQHLTPELVWRPEWQQHANHVQGMASLEIAVPDVSAALPRYTDCLLGTQPETLGGSGSQASFRLRGCALHLRRHASPAAMTGLTFEVASLDSVAAHLTRSGIGFDIVNQTILIDPAITFGATLQFRPLAH